MPVVGVTRARVRSLLYAPSFALAALRTTAQARRASGFLGGALMPEGGLTFWTLTIWRDEEAMRSYMLSGAHGRAMPRFITWCDEASVVHWTQDTDAVPPWPEAVARMRRDGRPSRLKHPSPRHGSMSFPDPHMRLGGPLTPRR